MTARTNLLSAASAFAMAMAVGAAYAGELTADLLTTEELDIITAGTIVADTSGAAASVVASSTNNVTPGSPPGLSAATTGSGSGAVTSKSGPPGAIVQVVGVQ